MAVARGRGKMAARPRLAAAGGRGHRSGRAGRARAGCSRLVSPGGRSSAGGLSVPCV